MPIITKIIKYISNKRKLKQNKDYWQEHPVELIKEYLGCKVCSEQKEAEQIKK